MKNKVKKTDVEKIVEAFLKGSTEKRNGKYFIEGNALVYKTVAQQRYERPYWSIHNDVASSTRMEHRSNLKRLKDADAKGIIKIIDGDLAMGEECLRVEYEALVIETIALRLNTGDVIGNSSVLKYLGVKSHFGRTSLNRGETEVQRLLSKKVPMIPFSVFTEANLSMDSFTVIERGPQETIKVKRAKMVKKKEVVYFEAQHFTGASLFSVGGKVYLFDMDRRELEHGIVNPFVVEIPDVHASSIKEAYEILMPKEVKDALKQKQNVKRQGEWFFIAMPEEENAILEKYRKEIKDITLQAGPNRPNHAKGVQLYRGKPVKNQRDLRDSIQIEKARSVAENSAFYVTGKVTHAGREHADLTLKGWFKAIPNTAINSFTITGDID